MLSSPSTSMEETSFFKSWDLLPEAVTVSSEAPAAAPFWVRMPCPSCRTACCGGLASSSTVVGPASPRSPSTSTLAAGIFIFILSDTPAEGSEPVF